jgi:L-fuculose-phosphate aldolase
MMKRVTDTLRDLARACRILVMEGHGDFSLGHLSLRDPDGRGFWLKRNEFGIGEIRSERDFILDSAILQARPDVHVVAHTHPAHASVLSASPKGLSPYTLDADYFTAVPRHAADVALIQTADQGASLAATLGPNDAMFLANHGVAFCGRSVAHATCVGVFLERACRAELLGRQLMDDAGFPSPEARATRHSQIMTDQHVQHTWKFLNRKLEALYPDATPVY